MTTLVVRFDPEPHTVLDATPLQREILATWHAGSSLDRFVYRGSI